MLTFLWRFLSSFFIVDLLFRSIVSFSVCVCLSGNFIFIWFIFEFVQHFCFNKHRIMVVKTKWITQKSINETILSCTFFLSILCNHQNAEANLPHSQDIRITQIYTFSDCVQIILTFYEANFYEKYCIFFTRFITPIT